MDVSMGNKVRTSYSLSLRTIAHIYISYARSRCCCYPVLLVFCFVLCFRQRSAAYYTSHALVISLPRNSVCRCSNCHALLLCAAARMPRLRPQQPQYRRCGVPLSLISNLRNSLGIIFKSPSSCSIQSVGVILRSAF